MSTRVVQAFFALIFFITLPVSAQDINDQVFRIKSSACEGQSAPSVLTGFSAKVNEMIGLVTSLHGVVGCDNILAENLSSGAIDGLNVTLVDVFRDVAFLQAEKLELAVPLRGAKATTATDLKVVGYPQAIRKQLSHPTSFHENARVKLSTLVPPSLLDAFDQRDSPDLEADVLSLRGGLQSGYSGAPILNTDGKVIGVASGGLVGGFADVNWAIPFVEISWSKTSEYKRKLERLAQLNPNGLFALSRELSSSGRADQIGYILETFPDYGYIVIKLETGVAVDAMLEVAPTIGEVVTVKVLKVHHRNTASASVAEGIHRLRPRNPVYAPGGTE